ncbi:MAG: DUF5103 domain-containing protein [Flavobacteriales bacterium]|nr:DUF5103 domain-containing protein [Flavobacteriales bacterium]
MRYLAVLALLCKISLGQVQQEIAPPANIKTVTFVQSAQSIVPNILLGTAFELQFDDLFGDESDYYYTITHCNYDWTPSNLAKNEYLTGNDDVRIMNYENSFNTLQIYSHYRLQLPNNFTGIKLSGNYIIKIFDEDKQLVFARRLIVYEDLCIVPIQVRRSRDIKTRLTKHNLDFSIDSQEITFQNPMQNVKILIMQNGQWSNAITNIKPQYTILNDLVYKYNAPTQFWAGNESRYWDNKDIKMASNAVSRVDLQKIYHTYLFGNTPRKDQPYTYYPDINNNFFVRNIMSELPQTEADYSWVFFQLDTPKTNKNIYITGMFNNYELSEANLLKYNKELEVYQGAVLAKQGFTSYHYTLADKNGKIDEENAIDGNFFQTENAYSIFVYYRENGARYDRIIGKGTGNSQDIIN